MIKHILYTMINCRITNFIDIKINVVVFSIRHLHQLSSKISKKCVNEKNECKKARSS